MSNHVIAAGCPAGFLIIAIPLTGPFERRIYRSNPETRLKLLTYSVNTTILWIMTITALWVSGAKSLFLSPTTEGS